MKIMKRRTFSVFLSILLILALLAVGCEQSDSDEEGNGTDTSGAPTVPPEYSLVPSFGDLAGSDTAEASAATDLIDNYVHARWHVGFWNTVIVVGLAVPVWAFGESFHHDPEEQDDGSWVWSYSAHVPSPNGILHTAELNGSYVDNESHWEMYITKEGHYEDFNWYSGVANLPATEGYWILKEGPTDPHDLLQIDWDRDTSAGTWQVKYTNIKEGATENGGYINYGVTSDETYDAFYDIYNKGQDNLVEIETNRTTKAGRVKNPKHFGDEEWHYWDSSHSNIDAP